MKKNSLKNKIINALPLSLFVLSSIIGCYIYGVVSHRLDLFPNKLLDMAYEELKVLKKNLLVYDGIIYIKNNNHHSKALPSKHMQPGLTKITGFGTDGILIAKVVDQQGNDIHSWNVDWFKVWPDAKHLPPKDIPRSRPGTTLHGSIVTSDGGLIYNYEKLGLVHLDACSNVVWRLPRRTHHSIFMDDNQHLWVPDLYVHQDQNKVWPNHQIPFQEFKILQVSLKGEVLQEISVMGLLEQNDLQGLLYMSAKGKPKVIKVSGDSLHLNDIEIFPSTMKEGKFSSGDIMISLRNLNAIMVFSQSDKKLKYLSIGKYIRQHDPDFVDGNTISVFDNNNLTDLKPEPYSRIVLESALTGNTKEYYAGKLEERFFTSILGKHQWLDNGNVLITASLEGRVIEVKSNKEIIWEYFNVVSENYIGAITEAERLLTQYDKSFFESAIKNCTKAVATSE